MITQTFIIALLVTVSSAENKRVCRCTFDYQPICASDGVVYSNKCLFQCAKLDNPTLSILAEGQCPDDSLNIIEDGKKNEPKDECFCTMELRPLCGSDDVVYGNPCLFECAKKNNPSLSVLHTGECDSAPSLPQIVVDPPVEAPCICTREFKPVCARGSDGKEITYGNICEFNCAKQKTVDLLLVSSQSCTA